MTQTCPGEWTLMLRVPNLWRILVRGDKTQDDAKLLSDDCKNAVFGRLLKADTPITTRHRTIGGTDYGRCIGLA